MSEQLKPCPFCGGEGKLYDNESWRTVICQGCGASSFDAEQSVDEALESWNRRAPSPSAIVAALEAERNAVARRFASGAESMPGHSTANFIGGIGRAIDIVKELSK